MVTLSLLTLAISLLGSALASAFDYSGYKLVRFDGFTKEQEEYLEGIEADVWGTDEEARQALVQLSPSQYATLQENLSFFGNYTIIQNDLQQALKSESDRIFMSEVSLKANNDPLSWFNEFHRYEQVKFWFETIERNEKDLVKIVKSIGKSHEGRDIFAVHLSEFGGQKKAKPKVWVQCLIHAREWISGSVCQYIAHSLVDEYKRGSPQIRSLLKESEIVLIPIVNPDGYAHSWEKNRLWRKNRRGQGTDLNRNFSDHWGLTRDAKTPTSDLFCGPGPASEPETKAIQGYFAYLNKGANPVMGALDYHSFSQLILRPFGWSDKPSPHDEYLKYVSNFMSNAMKSGDRQYVTRRSYELYPSSGSATDWFYSQGVKYSIAVELPPSLRLGDTSGFLLPATEILPVCRQAYAGFLTFADFVLHNPLG